MKLSVQNKMFGIIQEWQTEKLSRAEICRKHNISKSQFFYWLYKYQKTKTPEEKFVPIEIIKPEKTLSQIRILYPNQVTVIVENICDLNLIKQLINLS